MFSWITGPRITNVIEDLQTGAQSNIPYMYCAKTDGVDPAYETTFVEPPETPAHQFAVKAFKHAIFGTPALEEANNAGKKLSKKTKLDVANSKALEFPAPKENAAPVSPSKRPGGILSTPGTANKGRKSVSFGSQVMDNEAKKINTGRSGIPNDCPGKFPSPWTPGTELKLGATTDKKPQSKLTAALMDARSTPQPRSVQKPKAKDDSDITLDVMAPRSESGKYWKEQYESYADKSEREMKKLIAKQQLAKNFAKKKDGEMTEASTRLAEERKRFRQRERELEQQNKDYQERLRQAMAENAASSVEITALKNRISVLEKSFVAPSSEAEVNTFSIFEDPGENPGTVDPPSAILGRLVHSRRARAGDKENSPPNPRRMRRQTLSEASPRPTALPSAASESITEPAEIREFSSTSQTATTQPAAPFAKSTLTARSPGLPSKSPLSVRKPDIAKENLPPKSPVVLPSSPLPLPSPDPWMDLNDHSPLTKIDRLTFPMASGTSFRPVKSSQAKTTHRVSKSVSHTKPETSGAPSIRTVKPVEKPVRRESMSGSRRAERDPLADGDATVQMDMPKMAKSFIEDNGFTAPKRDVVKTASALANAKDYELATKEKAKPSVAENEHDRDRAERRAQAKARLAARKEKRQGA
jgi:hypothetical protein